MRFAALQGVAIGWWNSALNGSTLIQLHQDWKRGNALWNALLAGRETNMMAIACIASTFVVADGPLLQRASSVVPASIPDTPIPLKVTMVPEIPRDFVHGCPGTCHLKMKVSQEEIYPAE